MYCQSCGAEIQPGLHFCNRCGAQVASAAAAQAERVVFVPGDASGPVRWIAATICLTMILGFALLFTAVGHLAGRGVTTDPLVVISAVGLIGIFVVELSLIRMLSRLLFEGRAQAQLSAARQAGAGELRPAAAPQLTQPAVTTGPMHSVADHTTRTLEHAYRGPRA